MAELRWNPMIKDWVIIASHRQDRPNMPKDFCPFCPKFGKVPEYEVLKYDNDFPALSQNPPQPDDVASDFFKVKPAYGKCEVILYSPEHTTTIKELSVEHLEQLVELWQDRLIEIRKDDKMKYIFIFENKGEPVGVTMPHPHGQIYAYSVIPKKIQLEIESFKEAYEETGTSLMAQILENERADGRRIIFEDEHFTVFLPFFTEYPYGIYIASRRHIQYITDFTPEEKTSYAQTLKNAVGTLDSLFNTKFPYMMCMYNAPVNAEESVDYFHFHTIFYTPMRSASNQKYNGSSETGAWAQCNTVSPEAAAQELREAYKRFISQL